MATEIRPADGGDLPAIAELLSALGYAPPDDLDAKLAAWLPNHASRLYVAELEERVAGLVALHTWPHLERPGARGRITALVVAEQCRRRGLGRRLVERAERAARELGCTDMEVTSRREREEAQAFYRALGYEDASKRSARFTRRLSD